jgi:hypothetical protein
MEEQSFFETGWGLAFIIIVGLGISLILSYHIIKAATYGRKIWVEAQKQTRLLVELAKKENVDISEIEAIIEETQYEADSPFKVGT